jgi:hypothetical protein
MLRVKIVKGVCKLFRLPEPFWQIHRIAPADFATLSRDVVGIPTVMNWEIIKEGLWPIPEHCPRVYLGL